MSDRARMIMRNRNKQLMKKRMGQLIDQVVKVKRAKDMRRHIRAAHNSRHRASRVKELRTMSLSAKERISELRRTLSDVPRVTRARSGDAEREAACQRTFKSGGRGSGSRRNQRTADQVRGTYMRYLRNTGALHEETTPKPQPVSAAPTRGQLLKGLIDSDHHNRTPEQIQFVVRRLRRVPFLAALPSDKLRELARRSHVESHQRADRVFRQGESFNHLYVVLAGELSVTRTYKVARDATLEQAAARFRRKRQVWEKDDGPPPIPRNPDGVPLPRWGRGCRQYFGAGRRLDIDIWRLNKVNPDEKTNRMHLPPPAPMKSKRRFASSGPMPTDDAEDEEFVTEQEVTRLKENDYFGDRSLVGMWTTPGVGVADTFLRLLVLSREQYQDAMQAARDGQVGRRIKCLEQVDLFSGVRGDVMQKLAAGCAEGEYKAGTHILKAGRDNDMLYFVMSGVCRESAVVTPEEVEAKRLATLAKKKDVHRVGPVSVSPPHPTRANTLKAQLEATGRAQLAGPSGQPRVPFATLVPAFTDGEAHSKDNRPDDDGEDGGVAPRVTPASWGNLHGFVSDSLLRRHVVDLSVGQAFGDVAALLMVPQPTDVFAHTDVQVLSISKTAFRTRVTGSIVRHATELARQRAKWRHYTVKGIKSAVSEVERLVHKRQGSALEQHPVLPPSAFTSTRVPQLHGSLPMPAPPASTVAGTAASGAGAAESGAGEADTTAPESAAAGSRPGSATGYDLVRMSRTAPRPSTLAALDTLLPADDGTMLPARVLATSLQRNSLRHLSMSAPVGLIGGLSLPPSPLPVFSPTSRASASPTNRGLLSPLSPSARGEERPGWSSTPLRTPSRGASRGGASLTATWRSASPGPVGVGAPSPYTLAVGDSFGGAAERTRTPPTTLASMFARTGSSRLPPSTPLTGGARDAEDSAGAGADELGTTVSSLPLQPYVFVPAPEPPPRQRRKTIVLPQGDEVEAAATRVQSAMRGRMARRRVARIRGEDNSEEQRILNDMAKLDDRLRHATPLRQARLSNAQGDGAGAAPATTEAVEGDAEADGGGDAEAGSGGDVPGGDADDEEELLSALDDIDSKLKQLQSSSRRQPRRRRQLRGRTR